MASISKAKTEVRNILFESGVKWCSGGCEEFLPIKYFYEHEQGANGRDSKCIDCRNTYQRARREENLEQVRAVNQAWREANRQQINTNQNVLRNANRQQVNMQAQGYREENRERINLNQRLRREANREQRRADREANREQINAYYRTYYIANIEQIRANGRAGASRRRAAELGLPQDEDITLEKLREICEDDCCYYCELLMNFETCNKFDSVEMDHVKPLQPKNPVNAGGTTWDNIVLACSGCNRAKSNFVLFEEWFPVKGVRGGRRA